MDTPYCRICKGTHLEKVISLGEQYLTSRFPVYGDFSTPKTTITLLLCRDCGLVQLKETTPCEELYEHEYGYRSGINQTMRSHLKAYQKEIMSMVGAKAGDIILDTGSNDSTMLQCYDRAYRRIGIDPTGSQFRQYYGEVELIPTYFTRANFLAGAGETARCKVVTSISMFYDLPDPVQFAQDVYSVLEEDGLWSIELSYLPTMLKTNSLDTICHEHLEYYALHQIQEIATRARFQIIDVKFNDCNGGSFRIYLAKDTSTAYTANTAHITAILQEEIKMDIMNPRVYRDFMAACDKQIAILNSFIEAARQSNKTVYIYGASTKGNCILQYANIGEEKIPYAVERNPSKIGKMTSTGIPIIGEEEMRLSPPDYLFVLPWHFKKEIVEREAVFLAGGGQIIFALPEFEVVSSRPKVLITGCDGMIAYYVRDQFKDTSLYGFGRSSTVTAPLTKFSFNMNNMDELTIALTAIRPDIIIHLAAISSSKYAADNPLDALNSNGMVVAKICDIIHRNGWKTTKFFNASSSEIYKGHVKRDVQDDDTHMYHNHPYSIAKILGKSVVEFYRDTYGYPFSNGVIFTTESPRKRPEFLLNKVAKHIREWTKGASPPLSVGNLDSHRTLIHANDVATAIRTIVSQPRGDTYLICSTDKSYRVYDLVLKLFEYAGVEITEQNNILYSGESPILIIQDDVYKGFESNLTDIRGTPDKLIRLGWKPQYTTEMILKELI